jgi:hypothetical protein
MNLYTVTYKHFNEWKTCRIVARNTASAVAEANLFTKKTYYNAKDITAVTLDAVIDRVAK